jgi:hypothetical protein
VGYFTIAVLDTMWGDKPGHAPSFFRINPKNHSGRRLYSLIGTNSRLLVTDACRELVTKASHHGTPDPIWLRTNLLYLEAICKQIDVILVCGKVAQKTFQECKFTPKSASIIEIPHPAARVIWTREYIETVKQQIQEKRANK